MGPATKKLRDLKPVWTRGTSSKLEPEESVKYEMGHNVSILSGGSRLGSGHSFIGDDAGDLELDELTNYCSEMKADMPDGLQKGIFSDFAFRLYKIKLPSRRRSV